MQPLAFLQENPGGGFDPRAFVDSAARTPLSGVLIIVAVFTVLRLAIYPYLKNKPQHLRTGIYPAVKFLSDTLDAVIYAGVFVFMVIRPFLAQAFLVPSGSMWSTINVNDFLGVNKAVYRYTDPKVNDIVVFKPPIDATEGHPEQVGPDGQVNVDFVKRCVGVPGDIVELRHGTLYRNGQAVPDSHKHYSTTHDQGKTFQDLPADQVPMESQPSFKWIQWKGQVIPLNYNETEANTPVNDYDNSCSVARKYVIVDRADQMKAIHQPPVALPVGEYMMMGDNRNNSFDSRGWGMISRDAIVGRSEFIWLPLPDIGITR